MNKKTEWAKCPEKDPKYHKKLEEKKFHCEWENQRRLHRDGKV